MSLAAAAAPEACKNRPVPVIPTPGPNLSVTIPVDSCLKSVIDYHALLSVSDAVRRVVTGRLADEGSADPEPAGLALTTPQDIAARLSGAGPIAIEPVADVPAAPAAQRSWNAWIDGKYSWIDGKSGIDHAKGPLTNVMAGIDYRLSSSVVFGIMGTYEDSRLETDGLLPLSQKTEGYGGGAYVGVTVTPNIIFSGMATYAAIDTDLGRSRDADSDSDRVQVSGAFTGYWYSGTTRFSPSVTLAWSKEWQDEYSDELTPEQRFETGVLSSGAVVGHTFALSDTATVEPWIGAFLDYTFINDADTEGPLDTGSFGEQQDIRLQAGLNLNLASNVQLVLTGETSGLLLDETDTYAGEANLAIQF